MRRVLGILLVVVAGAVALVWAGEAGLGPILITHEGEQKMVLMLGSPVSVRTEPGLSLRIPLLTDVRTFDGRLLYLNAESKSTRTQDEERILVDDYVMWRIRDPLQFYASFPTGIEGARERIDTVVEDDLRGQIGRRSLHEVVTTARVQITDDTRDAAAAKLTDYGIDILAVRINRTELPEETEVDVYKSMRAERGKLARKYRAEGDEQGRTLRADADLQAARIRAEARRDSAILRGEGDAIAAAIFAKAHATAPEFYSFVRRLEAYRKTIGPHTTLVLPPDNDFFSLLATPAAEAPASAGASGGNRAPHAPAASGPVDASP